jgi:hypothetical protein
MKGSKDPLPPLSTEALTPEQIAQLENDKKTAELTALNLLAHYQMSGDGKPHLQPTSIEKSMYHIRFEEKAYKKTKA